MTQLFLQDILGRFLVTVSLIGTIEAHATGAPNSLEVCQYMFPGHEVDAQSTKPPFVIELKKKTFSEGGDKIEGTPLFTLYTHATVIIYILKLNFHLRLIKDRTSLLSNT